MVPFYAFSFCSYGGPGLSGCTQFSPCPRHQNQEEEEGVVTDSCQGMGLEQWCRWQGCKANIEEVVGEGRSWPQMSPGVDWGGRERSLFMGNLFLSQ